MGPTHQMTEFNFDSPLGNQIGSIPNQKATEYVISARPRQCYIFLSVLDHLYNSPVVLTTYSLLNGHFPPSTVFPKLRFLIPLPLLCNLHFFPVIRYFSKEFYLYFREENFIKYF